MLLLRKSSLSLVKTWIPRVNVSLSDQKYVQIYSMTLIIPTLLKKRDRDIITPPSVRQSHTLLNRYQTCYVTFDHGKGARATLFFRSSVLPCVRRSSICPSRYLLRLSMKLTLLFLIVWVCKSNIIFLFVRPTCTLHPLSVHLSVTRT